jgi:hypothetical protein
MGQLTKAVALVWLILLSSCHLEGGNYLEQRRAAESSIVQFWQLYDQRRFDEMYLLTSDDLQHSQSRKDFAVAIDRTFRALGRLKTSG